MKRTRCEKQIPATIQVSPNGKAIEVFPDVPVSQKPTEVRMGSGKGNPEFWVARVHPGRIMFEIDGVPDAVARQALKLGAAKLPIKTKIVTRIGG
jgi:large subunit ribosomal protein L16